MMHGRARAGINLEDGILIDGMLPRQLLAFFEAYRE